MSKGMRKTCYVACLWLLLVCRLSYAGCSQYLVAGKRFALREQGVDTARFLAEAVDMKRVKKNLRVLTGLDPINAEGNRITGRVTNEQKEKARRFLWLHLEDMGLDPRLESLEVEEEFKRYEEPDVVSYREPLNLRTVSGRALARLWRGPRMRMIKEFIVKVQGGDNNPEIVREMDLDGLAGAVREWDLPVHLQKAWILKEIDDLKARIELAGPEYETPRGSVTETISIQNLVVEIPGTEWPEEIIEVMAHYDTAYHEKSPGADDNGSGVAAALEVARILRSHPAKRTVRIIFADHEETGFYGSTQHVAEVARVEDNVVGALIVDTIGYAPIGREHPVRPSFVLERGTEEHHALSSGYRKTKSMATALKFQFKKYSDRGVTLDIMTEDALPATADHGPYWDGGLPALLLAAPYTDDGINPGYHSSRDELVQMNWGYYEETLRFVVESVATLACVGECEFQDLRPIDLNYLDNVRSNKGFPSE